MSDLADAEALAALLARVHALRNETSLRLDPLRLRYAQALANRLAEAPPAVQRVLQPKLEHALEAMGAGTEQAARAVAVDAREGAVRLSNGHRRRTRQSPPEPAAGKSLLGQLNQHIHNASQQTGNGCPLPVAPVRQDLKSAVRFRETWARISAEAEVEKAAHRAPENAGPLNAHYLVLRTLALMRELSPDYLRRFMSHTESLLWLDQALGRLKPPAGKGKAQKQSKAKP